MHNALQGGTINLSERKKEIYKSVIHENSVRNHLDHDFVIIHDPQPLPMSTHYQKKGPWIWRSHVDLSNPHQELFRYLRPFIEKMHAVIVSIEEYKRDIETPQLYFMPAIDPFSIKNKKLSESQIMNRLKHYKITIIFRQTFPWLFKYRVLTGGKTLKESSGLSKSHKKR